MIFKLLFKIIFHLIIGTHKIINRCIIIYKYGSTASWKCKGYKIKLYFIIISPSIFVKTKTYRLSLSTCINIETLQTTNITFFASIFWIVNKLCISIFRVTKSIRYNFKPVFFNQIFNKLIISSIKFNTFKNFLHYSICFKFFIYFTYLIFAKITFI